MTADRLRTAIEDDEGTGPMRRGRFFPYWDCCGRELRAPCENGQSRHAGKLTIGRGRNLEDRGLSRLEVDGNLDHDIEDAIKDLVTKFPGWFPRLDPVRQAVLVQMCFNLGIDALMGFRNTLQAFARGDFEAAAAGIRDSKAARVDAPRRYERLAKMTESGEWV